MLIGVINSKKGGVFPLLLSARLLHKCSTYVF